MDLTHLSVIKANVVRSITADSSKDTSLPHNGRSWITRGNLQHKRKGMEKYNMILRFTYGAGLNMKTYKNLANSRKGDSAHAANMSTSTVPKRRGNLLLLP